MSRSTLEWYESLGRGLGWAAVVVLLLSVIGAIIIAGSDTALPLVAEAERQGRGILALASLGGGLTSAGLLAGVGAIVRMLVSERLAKLGPDPSPDDDASREEPGTRGTAES